MIDMIYRVGPGDRPRKSRNSSPIRWLHHRSHPLTILEDIMHHRVDSSRYVYELPWRAGFMERARSRNLIVDLLRQLGQADDRRDAGPRGGAGRGWIGWRR